MLGAIFIDLQVDALGLKVKRLQEPVLDNVVDISAIT
jgi:hypothetical protein